jgi:hypothetical protein
VNGVQRTALLPKGWWRSRTEPSTEEAPAAQDVDMACGMVMALAAWEGEPLPRLMRRGLRRALRRLYAEDRGCERVPEEEPFGRGTS